MENEYMDLREQLLAYKPWNEQEERDRGLILKLIESGEELYTRDNEAAHFTASAWVVDQSHTKVLMAYHNIYHSWAWLGGHADGDHDLLHVALKEVQEESSVKHVHALSNDIYSLEILTVDGHVKRGKYVSSHLHLNVTYLLEADSTDSIHNKPDENSGVAWFDKEKALRKCSEPWMIEHVYRKLNDKMESFLEASDHEI